MKLILRSGYMADITADQAIQVANILQNNNTKYFMLEGEMYNSVEVVAILSDRNAETYKHELAGDWQCKKSRWHKRNRQCDCRSVRYDNGMVAYSGTGDLPSTDQDDRFTELQNKMKRLALSKQIKN